MTGSGYSDTLQLKRNEAIEVCPECCAPGTLDDRGKWNFECGAWANASNLAEHGRSALVDYASHCDVWFERDAARGRVHMLNDTIRDLEAQLAAWRPVVEAATSVVGYMTPHHWATLTPPVIVPSMHAMRNAVDALRATPTHQENTQ